MAPKLKGDDRLILLVSLILAIVLPW